jgi:hypothetical protein
MEFQTRPVPGKPGAVEPVMAGIPISHHGRRIGEGVLDSHGNLSIHIQDLFDQDGIFRMFMTGEGAGLVIGVEHAPALEIRKIINRED